MIVMREIWSITLFQTCFVIFCKHGSGCNCIVTAEISRPVIAYVAAEPFFASASSTPSYTGLNPSSPYVAAADFSAGEALIVLSCLASSSLLRLQATILCYKLSPCNTNFLCC